MTDTESVDPEQCECEWDWRCGQHQGQFTPQELSNDEYAKRDQDPREAFLDQWYALNQGDNDE